MKVGIIAYIATEAPVITSSYCFVCVLYLQPIEEFKQLQTEPEISSRLLDEELAAIRITDEADGAKVTRASDDTVTKVECAVDDTEPEVPLKETLIDRSAFVKSLRERVSTFILLLCHFHHQ